MLLKSMCGCVHVYNLNEIIFLMCLTFYQVSNLPTFSRKVLHSFVLPAPKKF